MPSPKAPADGVAHPSIDLEAIASVNRRSFHAMTEMNRSLYRNMVSVHSEILEFTQRRLAEDVAAARQLAACNRPDAAMQIIHGYQARAFEDFSHEAGALMRLGASATANIARDAVSAASGDVSEPSAG